MLQVLKRVTGGYTVLLRLQLLQGVLSSYKGLVWITRGFQGLQSVKMGYRGLKGLQGVTKGYKGLQ